MNKTKTLLACGAIAAVTALAGISSVGAIVIRGAVDPIFGGTGSGNAAGLYWTADIAFSVLDSCVTGANSDDASGHSCTITGLSVTGTLGANQSDPSPTLFNFLTNPGPSSPITSVMVRTSNGIVTGIDTPQIGATSFSYSSIVHGFAWVDFDFGGEGSMAQLLLQLCDVTDSVNQFASRFSFSSYGHDCGPVAVCVPTAPTDRSSLAEVTITQVPEPGIVWLLLATVSAAWLVRRRSARR